MEKPTDRRLTEISRSLARIAEAIEAATEKPKRDVSPVARRRNGGTTVPRAKRIRS